ncbi:glycosyltransferase family 2 protein [Microcella sp.]|uniref:glycosyltransferase family 2 protein n=1 Tax=Microcella sp. TaxID=1913979 RepID=UPI003F6FA5D5
MGRAVMSAAPAAAVTAVSMRQSIALATRESFLLEGNPEADRLQWLASLDDLPPRSILAHGLSTRSGVALDYFALRATQWRFDAQALHGMLAETESDPVATSHAVGPCDANALVALTRLLLGHGASQEDRSFARRVHRLAVAQTDRLSPLNRQYLAQHLLLDGEFGLASNLLSTLNGADYPGRFFHLDLINPFAGAEPRVPESVWVTALGGVFRRAGLEPLELLPTGPSPFDRLSASAPVTTLDGPMVTVIMSCYEPGPGLVTAVRSMLAQTWTNWELIVTDDASPSSPDELLDAVAAMDPRVRVMRSAVNRGTYVRRNEALREAQGELITMQDSDDWVHPRRLEIQVRHLLENPEIVANLSQSLRVSEDLRFVQPRGASIRLTESSLLFRKDTVRALIGEFDSVRKAADSEFRMRLETSVGYAIPLVDVEAPLSMVRHDISSLSGGDLGDGWMHPARVAYRSAQSLWRRERLSRGLPLTVDSGDTERAFPAHPHLTGAARSVRDLDVLYVVDARSDTGLERYPIAAAAELERLAAAGLTVGFRRAEAVIGLRPPSETHDALQTLVNRRVVVEVLSVDIARATVLVARHPETLAGVSRFDQTIEAERVVVVGSGGRMPDIVIANAIACIAPAARTRVSRISESAWGAEVEALCRREPESASVTA